MSLSGLMVTMIVAGMIFLALRGSCTLNRSQQSQQSDVGSMRYGEIPFGGAARASLDADITRFGDELRDLDLDMVSLELSEETRANYSEALGAYENTRQTMSQVHYESDTITIAHILEEGHYTMAYVRLRAQGQPVPERRPLCFFDPAYGPSTRNVTWAPLGGMPREAPACTFDAAHITSGVDPHIRMVQQDYQAAPYWQDQGHAAYARGYYEPYGLDSVVQGLAKGALLSGGLFLLMGLLDD